MALCRPSNQVITAEQYSTIQASPSAGYLLIFDYPSLVLVFEHPLFVGKKEHRKIPHIFQISGRSCSRTPGLSIHSTCFVHTPCLYKEENVVVWFLCERGYKKQERTGDERRKEITEFPSPGILSSSVSLRVLFEPHIKRVKTNKRGHI